ncbi:hypothetical protein ACXZ9C_11425 [Streptococcus agalactiae]
MASSCVASSRGVVASRGVAWRSVVAWRCQRGVVALVAWSVVVV